MDCIIVGAGAAGLMAANILSAAGKKVVVLEAAQRLGGRIHTIYNTVFSTPVEAGAEFIHGKLPLTMQLLKEARINYVPITGGMWQRNQEGWQEQKEETTDWNEVIQKMNELKEDMSLADFLYQEFGDTRYSEVRESVQRFAEGFDLADIFTVSTFALRDEWSSEEEQEYRIPDGYSKLIAYLEEKCKQAGCEIITGCRVTHIDTTSLLINIHVADGRTFTAPKAIVTVSLGVLQQTAEANNHIHFSPALTAYQKAFQSMGYGTVIKVVMEFKQSFWEAVSGSLCFAFGNEQVPTWWTQLSLKNGILTGWLGGPNVLGMQYTNKQVIFDMAIKSLASMFEKTEAELQEMLARWDVYNWSADLFTAGAYSFSTLSTAKALKKVSIPVENKLWFAGEAIYDGEHPGTVEAALQSGKRVAEEIVKLN